MHAYIYIFTIHMPLKHKVVGKRLRLISISFLMQSLFLKTGLKRLSMTASTDSAYLLNALGKTYIQYIQVHIYAEHSPFLFYVLLK